MLLGSVVTLKEAETKDLHRVPCLHCSRCPDEKQVRETTELKEAQSLRPTKPLPIFPCLPPFSSQKSSLEWT